MCKRMLGASSRVVTTVEDKLADVGCLLCRDSPPTTVSLPKDALSDDSFARKAALASPPALNGALVLNLSGGREELVASNPLPEYGLIAGDFSESRVELPDSGSLPKSVLLVTERSECHVELPASSSRLGAGLVTGNLSERRDEAPFNSISTVEEGNPGLPPERGETGPLRAGLFGLLILTSWRLIIWFKPSAKC